MEKQLTTQVYDLMKEGIETSAINGVCLFKVDTETLVISYANGQLSCTEAYAGQPDVTVKMPSQVVKKILGALHKFDMRDPELLMNIAVEGNIDLASFLFSAIKRPSDQVLSYIDQAENQCQGYKDMITEIKRISKPSEEELAISIADSIPIVITDALDDWGMVSGTFETLKKKYGHFRLRPVLNAGPGVFETMQEFIERVEEKTGIYTEGCELPPALWSRFKLPYFDNSTFTTPQIWMGSKSVPAPCTNLHRDCGNGLLSNVLGRKKMILFSPDQTDYMYPSKAYNTYQTCGIKDVENVDLDKFPAFKNARPIEVILEPGDLLLIPAFWYHCVYAVDNVFSISTVMKWEEWEKINANNELADITI